LLPLEATSLLVPMTAIAEVIACEGEEQDTGEHTRWLYCYITWRDMTIPLISYEGVSGDVRPGLQPVSKVAIVNAVGVAADIGFYAIRLRQYPHPVHVDESHQLEFPSAEDRVPGVLMTATVDEAIAVIPDFELLEQYCARLRQQ
jgi:chemosensory pili system protein ChpC